MSSPTESDVMLAFDHAAAQLLDADPGDVGSQRLPAVIAKLRQLFLAELGETQR